MRTWWAGLLIVLAALLAAPAASAQDPAVTPTPTTATPTPSPTPTPEEIAEAERKEKLRKRKVVRRVYNDYAARRRGSTTASTRALALKRTLQSITDDFDTDFPDFRVAVKAAIKDHDAERCEQEQEDAAGDAGAIDDAEPDHDSGPDLAAARGDACADDRQRRPAGPRRRRRFHGGGGDGGGSGSKPPATDTSPPPTEGDVAPVQPQATPCAADTGGARRRPARGRAPGRRPEPRGPGDPARRGTRRPRPARRDAVRRPPQRPPRGLGSLLCARPATAPPARGATSATG